MAAALALMALPAGLLLEQQAARAAETGAEEAAKAIGANALLARTACLYHDIGKLAAPNTRVVAEGAARLKEGGMEVANIPPAMMKDFRAKTEPLLGEFLKKVPAAEAPVKAYLAEMKR